MPKKKSVKKPNKSRNIEALKAINERKGGRHKKKIKPKDNWDSVEQE